MQAFRHAPLCAALLALMCASASAQDLPRTPACRTALAALDEAESALAATASAPSAGATELERQRSATVRLTPLRRRVADACLGGLTTSPPPSQHTLVVPPLPAHAPTTPALPRATPPMPPVALPRPEAPVTVNSCNAVSCIASDGSTLTRVGPALVGPRGSCSRDGIFLRCP